MALITIDLGNVKGPKGDDGANGANGANFLVGSGAPAASLGAVGDSYLDTDGPTLYAKGANGWVAVASKYDSETVDLVDNDHYGNLRENVTQDTKRFLEACVKFTPDDYEELPKVRISRRGGVVTLYFDRKPWRKNRLGNDVPPETQYGYRYDYGTVTLPTPKPDDSGDHKNLGPVVPSGWRPSSGVRVPCEAWGMTRSGSGTEQDPYTYAEQRYVGMAEVQPDGAIAITRLHRVAGGTEGIVTDGISLIGLEFAATYVVP